MYRCLPVCISVHHYVPSVCGGQKEVLNTLDLQFYIVVSHNIGAENWKISHYSEPLSHLSKSSITFEFSLIQIFRMKLKHSHVIFYDVT